MVQIAVVASGELEGVKFTAICFMRSTIDGCVAWLVVSQLFLAIDVHMCFG